MKKKITISCFLLSFFVLLFIIGTQSACQKQNTNCTCIITIDSGAGLVPVSGAKVKLYTTLPHSTAGDSGVTDGSGEVTFTFDLPAIFNVSAKYTRGKNDTIEIPAPSPLIQLQIGQTESATYTLTTIK